jgi:uncharacterized protein involved in propanediol utilization
VKSIGKNTYPVRMAETGSSPCKCGRGISIAQYGELFQGEIGSGKQRTRCLLSLPCKELVSQVAFDADQSGFLFIKPPHKQKTKKVVELTLRYLGAPQIGGFISVESNIPEAKGCGSSTADCVAGAIAAAAAIGMTLTQDEIAHLVVEAEVASDNIMFKHAVLFAHRKGVLVEDYGKELPLIDVLGIDTKKDSVVDTLEFSPAVYSEAEIESFNTLVIALRRALRENDIRLLGTVATASAAINERFLPKPMFREIRSLAEYAGALGIAVAHSGTVLAILLDPNNQSINRQVNEIKVELSKLGIDDVLRYQT